VVDVVLISSLTYPVLEYPGMCGVGVGTEKGKYEII
jgi:hypothetical protein